MRFYILYVTNLVIQYYLFVIYTYTHILYIYFFMYLHHDNICMYSFGVCGLKQSGGKAKVIETLG